jgi:hypothetical protein
MFRLVFLRAIPAPFFKEDFGLKVIKKGVENHEKDEHFSYSSFQ